MLLLSTEKSVTATRLDGKRFISFCFNKQISRNRITVDNIYYYKSQAHSNRFILSFIHHFGKERKCEFAYSIPYTYTRLQEFLNQIDSKKLDYYWRSPLCNTVVSTSLLVSKDLMFQQKRRIDLLTISSPENLLHRQKIVFMTARVHPGESKTTNPFVHQDKLLSSLQSRLGGIY